MNDDQENGSSDKSSKKEPPEIVTPVFMDFLKNVNDSSFHRSIEQIRKIVSHKSIQNIGQLKLDPVSADAAKKLSVFAQASIVKNLPTLFPYSEFMVHDFPASSEALKRLFGSLSDTQKHWVYTRAASVLAQSDGSEWLDFQKNSILFKYFSSDIIAKIDTAALVDLEVGAISPSSEGESDAIEIAPKLEMEIVTELEGGGDFSDLSDKAKRYLAKWLPVFLLLLELMSHWITFSQYYEEQISAAKDPVELRLVLKNIPAEHRGLFEGERVVIKNNVILRSGPGKETEELGRLNVGDRLEEKAVRGSWVLVSVDLNGDELDGWVYAPFTVKI